MINAMLGLGIWVVLLSVYWLYSRVRDWWYSPVMSSHTVTLAPGEKVVKYCAHQQAEPVVLSTGETVSCVCIACFDSLPANWITNQRLRAEIKAHCTHDDPIEITAFGQADRRYTCSRCGSWLSDSTWPTMHH